MLVTIKEYAEMYNKEASTVRKRILAGELKTAKKIGKTWVLDPMEQYPSNSYKPKNQKGEKNE